MNMRRLFRAALLASVLTTVAACGGTDPEPNPPPDAGPIDNGNPDPVPTATDSDGDGLPNAIEDKNANGRVDEGETDPNNRDSDCDGLIDGPDTASFKGEDQNANGTVDTGETNPTKPDTDGDGLTDGVERGVTTNLNPTVCTSFVADADPSTTTDPANPDSDGDGMQDGAEDGNQDGKVDPGELDPKNDGDATGPAAQVCTTDKLRPVEFRTEGDADLKVALPAAPRFGEITPIVVGGQKLGFMGYDSTTKVAFLAYRQAAPAGKTTPEGDETALRSKIAASGALSNELTQSFTTWDGYAALKAQYDQAGTADVKARANAIATSLAGAGAGSLVGSAGAVGPFRIQAQYIHRSDKSVVVLVAITPRPASGAIPGVDAPIFTVNDLSQGSAVAQFVDTTAVQCEPFASGNAKVDFLFVVDDSGSMATSQDSLSKSATFAAEALRNSSLDWRVAMVTSNYHMTGSQANVDKLRPFTRNINQLKAWLAKDSVCSSGICSLPATTAQEPEAPFCPGDASWGANGGCWVGISGSGTEGVLGAARKAVKVLNPATPVGGAESTVKARADATLVIILLADADDQTRTETTTIGNCGSGGSVDKAGSECESVENFKTFFNERSIPVHGIVCPSGSFCGCTSGTCNSTNTTREFNPQPLNGEPQQRHAAVVRATGGILGSIIDETSIQTSITAIVQDAIGSAGYKLTKAPIGASIKVALASVAGACAKDDIPRSRVNGFDFDGSAIAFYGACRAPTVGTPAAVSYRYWVDGKSDADGKAPCFDDPKYDPNEADHCQGYFACTPENACVCKAPTSCPAGMQFNNTACICEPVIG